MHEYIPVVILVVGLFAGIWINRRDFSDLKSDMNRQFDMVHKRLDRVETEVSRRLDHIDSRLDRVDSDLREFYGADKQLEGRVNELSARIK